MATALQEQTKIAKILANKNRLQMLRHVGESSRDLCVYQLSEKLGISQSLASHQLAYLSSHGVVEGYRDGQTMCYKSSDSSFARKVFGVVRFLAK